MFCRFLFIFTCFVFLFFPYRISAQADDFLLNGDYDKSDLYVDYIKEDEN